MGANALDNWPRLSETLTGPKSPDRCQSCGCEGSVDPLHYAGSASLERWREHNAFDKPESIIVVLCPSCSDRLIEKHPRLYAQLVRFQPVPGCIPLCLDCKHRTGTRCSNPKAQSNGGEGLHLYGPEPTDVHILRRGKGARSGWEKWYQGPTSRCDGRELVEGSEVANA